jgi:hypothetical protein
MDYLDNPERRSAARPSDDTSANSYGFAVASTPRSCSSDNGNALCAGTTSSLSVEKAIRIGDRFTPTDHRAKASLSTNLWQI